MPLVSKILFGLSILALIITAIVVLLNWRKEKKDAKSYRRELGNQELEKTRKLRLEKEAEVIRLFNEHQKQMNQELQEGENSQA